MKKIYCFTISVMICIGLTGCGVTAKAIESTTVIDTAAPIESIDTVVTNTTIPPQKSTLLENTETEQSIQYDESLLNLWVKKYQMIVVEYLSLSYENWTPQGVALLNKQLDEYVSEDCSIWGSLQDYAGSWSNYRGVGPYIGEGGYTITFDVKEASDNTVVINTIEQINGVSDTGDPIEETSHCSYKLNLQGGEYICLEADTKEFFNAIETYAVGSYDPSGNENNQETEATTISGYELTSVQTANNSVLLTQSSTEICFIPPYCAYDYDYVKMDISNFASQILNDEDLTFPATIYWDNYPVRKCGPFMKATVTSKTSQMVNVTVVCGGAYFSEDFSAYDVLYLTYTSISDSSFSEDGDY